MDGALFSLSDTGTLSFLNPPDYEDPGDSDGDGVYEVTVKVSDATNTTTADLEVTITDVAPALAGPEAATYNEEKRGLRVATYTIDDGDAWSLAGDDAARFTIVHGRLRFVDPPDFESASDHDADNVYNVTVHASDGTTSESLDVSVTVSDVDEPGSVVLSPLKPGLGTAVTAELADPDTVSGTPAWVWERALGRDGWETIANATSASYTPLAADADRYLRATATYTDRFGAGKQVRAIAPHVVIAHRLSELTVSGLTGVPHDNRAFYPSFNAETLHYAARCGESLNLRVRTQDAEARVSVNGVQRPRGTVFTVGGLDGESDIRVTLTGATGASTTYTIHCVDRNQFPRITTVKNAGAMEDLAMFRYNVPQQGQWWRSYLLMTDNNGVPRFRKRIEDRVGAYFRVFPDETHPRARYGFAKLASEGVELVVYDRYFNTVDDGIVVLEPFRNTDGHDFIIRPNGDYVLIAYNPARRDLRFVNEAFPDVRNNQGQLLQQSEQVWDSAIQVRTPGGEVKFNWSSWDHMAIEDCIGGTGFISQYAHLNSLGWFDGDIIAGFRRCSKILRIDPDTGSVVWRTGPSIHDRESWDNGETLQPDRGPAPLEFVNDPVGGFSGQHGGHITRRGDLLVFDNSTHCGTPPGVAADAKGLTQCGEATRAVEYAIDTVAGELVFQREFRIEGGNHGGSGGHAEPLDNGDLLISWSSAPPPNTAVQVDAETNTQKFVMTIDRLDETGSHVVETSRVLTINPVALAAPVEALGAMIVDRPDYHAGTEDRPRIVAAFNRPVVDVDSATPSVTLSGATMAVEPYLSPGAPAHAYAFTLTPNGDGEIRFQFNADEACGSDAICASDGSLLETVPDELVIPGPVVVDFATAAHAVTEGGSVSIEVTLDKAHGRTGNLTFPLSLADGTTASAADLGIPESVSFGSVETSRTVVVTAVADALVEGTETAELRFGPLPSATAAGVAAATVTVNDATDGTLRFSVGTTEVAEGNSTELVFAAGNGITFTANQEIDLTLGGTAATDDYTLAAGNRELSVPYSLELPAGANSASVTLSVVNDSLEEQEETILIEAEAGSISLGSHTIVVPANDGNLPVVTVSAGSPRKNEGGLLDFTLRRSGETAAPLAVAVNVRETGAMLDSNTPVSATIPDGAATVEVSVSTNDDSVVEPDSEVTLSVSSGGSYEVGAPSSATVTVADNDAAAFSLAIAPLEILEGEEADITLSIDNGVTFAADQTIDIAAGGSAGSADSVLNLNGTPQSPPYALTLAAGATSTGAALLAVDDAEHEEAETVILSARHGFDSIGGATVTIGASDAPTAITIAAGSMEAMEGSPVEFTFTRARSTEPDRLPELTIPIAVTDEASRLADAAPTSIRFAVDQTLSTLSLATDDDTFNRAGEARVTARVTPDAADPPGYEIVGTGIAEVIVSENDHAEWELVVSPTEVQEGDSVAVSLSIANGVTFDSRQRISILSDTVSGTAQVDRDFVSEGRNGSYALSIPPGRSQASLTLRTLNDTEAEGPETIVIVGEHQGSAINDPPITVTIAGNDGWVDENAPPALRFAVVNGETLTLHFDQALDAAPVPDAADFEVRVADLQVAVVSVGVSGRSLTLTLESAPDHGQTVTVSYTPGTDPIRDLQAQEAVAFAIVTAVETLVSIAPGRASEGEVVRFPVRLSHPVSDALTIDWRVDDLSTQAGADYPHGQGGSLTIPASETTGEIPVSTTEDTQRESDERFVVTLEMPAGFPGWAALDESAATGTIVDDDGPSGSGTGGGGGGGGGGGSVNRPPVVERIIPDQTVPVGETVDIDIRLSFYDRDQRWLNYTVEVADPEITEAAMSDETILTVRGLARGSTAVTVTAADRRDERVSQTFLVTVTGPALVAFFPRASDPARQGFLRIVSHSEEDGEVFVEAFDDRGGRVGPVPLRLRGNAVVHINSSDLEEGNAEKGLPEGVGPGEGDWRLILDSEREFEVLSYVRTQDGFLTAMHDVVPVSGGVHHVATFNPGSNPNQVSSLRIVNANPEDANVTITGVDDAGNSPGGEVRLSVPAERSATLSASDLESGAGVDGALGDGSGKWRLALDSTQPIVALSLLSSPAGQLTNLSTTAAGSNEDGVHVVPLFPAASDALGRQGFVRIVNRSAESGVVRIEAYDDSGMTYEALTLALDAGQTTHFNSNDLELGNAAKGLSGSTGPGVSDWRLELSSDTPVEVLTYIRTKDGFLTSIHDSAPLVGHEYWVATFNPGSNPKQVSSLRLVNPGTDDALVTIEGIDDQGEMPGSPVAVTVPSGASRTFTAAQLEAGTEVDGALGDGMGKWRLLVTSEEPVVVMSLLSNPTGHLTNLSTAPDRKFSLGDR